MNGSPIRLFFTLFYTFPRSPFTYCLNSNNRNSLQGEGVSEGVSLVYSPLNLWPSLVKQNR